MPEKVKANPYAEAVEQLASDLANLSFRIGIIEKELYNAEISAHRAGPQTVGSANGKDPAVEQRRGATDYSGISPACEPDAAAIHLAGQYEPARPVKEFGRSETGAMRESIGTKIRTHLVPYELTVAAALGLNHGEKKYDARNFEKGLSMLDLTGSVERHNKAIMDGEYIDADSGLPHFALLASSVAMLCHNVLQGSVVDDRPVPKTGLNIGQLAKAAKNIEAAAAYLKYGISALKKSSKC